MGRSTGKGPESLLTGIHHAPLSLSPFPLLSPFLYLSGEVEFFISEK